ncbi:MAG: hypothetical protein KGJ66_07570 [Alphaproteobacteria bacterium]|nr:hypothetical protein [Alphaproteobacteria bacterium]
MDELLEPIIIRYDGIDAEHHEIDLALLGESLKGGARLLAVAANIAFTGEYLNRTPSMKIRVLAESTHARCFTITVGFAGTVPLLPLLTARGRKLATDATKAIVNYMLAKLSAKPSEAAKAMDLVRDAIQANKEVTMKSLEVAERAVEKAGAEQRPAAKSFVAPVGSTVSTAFIGEREKAVIIDVEARREIDREEPVEIEPSRTVTVLITELDVKTGACKVQIHGDDSDERYAGIITDPVVQNPKSPYSAALDSQGWLKVVAKAHVANGEIQRLTISDTAA